MVSSVYHQRLHNTFIDDCDLTDFVRPTLYLWSAMLILQKVGLRITPGVTHDTSPCRMSLEAMNTLLFLYKYLAALNSAYHQPLGNESYFWSVLCWCTAASQEWGDFCNGSRWCFGKVLSFEEKEMKITFWASDLHCLLLLGLTYTMLIWLFTHAIYSAL